MRRFNSVSTFWQANMAMEDRRFYCFPMGEKTPISNLARGCLSQDIKSPRNLGCRSDWFILGAPKIPLKWGKPRWTRLVDAAKLSLRQSLWNLWAFVDVLYWQLKEAPVLKLELLQASGDENCDDSEGWRSNFWISTSCNTPEDFVNCWLQ